MNTPSAHPPLRIAVLGAGDMGRRHVAGWHGLGHDVVSVTDLDQQRAGKLAEEFHVGKVLGTYQEAVTDPGVDVVSICLPTAAHCPATVLAARHGKHVLTEKPLCRTFAEADEMEAAVRASGVVFGVGFQRNLAEGVGLLRSWAAAGRFGRPMVFSSDLLQEVRPKRLMHDRNANNGPLTDAGCHYYLLWQTVFRSKPRQVFAVGRVLANGRPEVADLDQLAVDTAVVTVEYDSGDIATFTVSWGLAAGTGQRSRPERLVGPLGAAEGGPNSPITVYDGNRVEEVAVEPRDLHRLELDLFAEAVRGGRPFPTGFRTGRHVLAITEAIFASIARGAPVPVSYD